jgi:hypothetical protein
MFIVILTSIVLIAGGLVALFMRRVDRPLRSPESIARKNAYLWERRAKL